MRHFLKNGFLLLGCLLVAPLQLTQGESEEGQQLVWEVWQIPASAVSTGKSLARTPKPGFVVREGSDKWDATEFVESLGGKKAPGSEATYHADQECLVVKNTMESISAIGSTISAAGLENAPAHIVSEFSIFECALDPKPENGFVAWPTYADLIGGNAKDARIVDSISGTTKSGLRSKLLRHAPTGEKNASPNTKASEKPALGSEEPGIVYGVARLKGTYQTIE